MAKGFLRRGRGIGVLELRGDSIKGEIEGRGGCTGDKVEGRDGRHRAGAIDEWGNEDGAGGDRSRRAGCDGGDVGKDIKGGQGTREVNALRFRGEET